ncbi:MAG: prepilin-type N-terminal cleavage/methylation domain-containing protein [Brevundimonas sp.]|uniref:prepilin-type N-terminal cleavage/methylation domain-containing protein n=1 Tax=Brevundimonas sp. TaxID=1871086 RepID=UPI00403363C2
MIRREPRRRGFSLIEALIALAIAAMMLTALFQLQIQMARGQARAAAVLEQVSAQENALALTRDLNPMEEPTGEIVLPQGDTIRWRSSPKTRSQPNVGFPRGNGMFDVQLFTVTVEIIRPDRSPVSPLTFNRLGWKRKVEADDWG